jgi:hypothetical protein
MSYLLQCLYIRDSNLGRDTGYTDWGFSLASLCRCSKMAGYPIGYTMAASKYLQFIFTN